MANEEVFGARFEIDVSNLKSGITQANRYVKEAESEFKAAAAGMDDWKNSEEGLSAKLKSLNSVADAQSAKVNALQKAYDEAAAEMGSTSAEAMNLSIRLNNATADFNKTQKEIKQTDTALQQFKSGANEAGNAAQDAGTDAAKAGDGFGDFSNSVVDTVKQLGGIAVAGMGIASIGEYLDGASGASSRLNATLGVTGDEAKAFDDALNNIYAGNYGESFDDIAESASRVVQIMGNDISPDALESVTTSALVLRDTFDMDVGESVKAVQVMMQNFGMSSEDAFDMIAAGAQRGLNINDDMLDSFSEYSPYFAQIGLDANDMFTAFASGADISMYGVDKAGDAFKEFGIRVVDGSDTTAQAFDAMGLDMDEYAAKIMEGGETAKGATSDIIEAMLGIEDPIAQNIAGVNLFGTQWEDLGQDGANAMLELMGTANDTAGTLDEIDSIRYDDIGNSLSAIGRTIEDSVLSPLVDTLTPAIADFSQTVIPMIQDGAQWFIDNLPTIVPLMGAIAGGFAAFQAASIIQTAVGAIQAFKTAQEAATVAQAAFNLVMNANPVMLIVTAIGALIAGLIVLWNTNEDFRNAVTGAWDAILGVVGPIIDTLVGFFTTTVPEALSALGGFFSNLPETIGGFLSGVLTNVGTWVLDLATKAIEAGTQFFTNVVNFFSQLPDNVWNLLLQVLLFVGQWELQMIQWAIQTGTEFLNNVINFFQQLPGKISAFLTTIINNVVAWVTKMAQGAQQAGSQFLNKVVSFVTQLPGKIAGFLTNIITNVGTWVGNMASNATNAGTQFLNNVVNFVTQLPGKIAGFLSDVIGKVGTFAGDFATGATNAATDFFNNIATGVGNVPGKIGEVLGGIPGQVSAFAGNMVSAGSDMIAGLVNGIAGGAGAIVAKIQEICSGALDAVKNFFGIASPSKLMKKMGGYIDEGLELGIAGGVEDVKRATEELSTAATPDIGNVAFGTSNRGRNSGSTLPTAARGVSVVQNFYSPEAITAKDAYRQGVRLKQTLAAGV